MFINEVLTFAIKKLKKVNIKNPHLEAELFLSYITGKPREYILTYPEHKLTKSQITNYKLLISKRLKGWSVATLIGEKEFYGLKFIVDKNVLIPRPETELIIDEALKIIKKGKHPMTIIDVGTGSGCIITALAKTVNNQIPIRLQRKPVSGQNSKYQFYAIDISNPALKIARQNARLHKINKIKFLHGNLLNPILKKPKLLIPNSYLLILANLPYLTPKQIENSPSIRKEPKVALDGGYDGLKYYKKLFQQIKTIKKTGVKYCLICEIDPSQKTKIKKIAGQLLGPATIEFAKDYLLKNRLAIIS